MSNFHFLYDVFLSYCPADNVWTETKLVPRLEKTGMKVMLADRDFDLGVSKLQNIEHAIDSSRHTLLVMTKAWLESDWAAYEEQLAFSQSITKRRQRTIPILLEPLAKLPTYIEMLTPADFTGTEEQDEQAMARLIHGVSTKARVCIIYAAANDTDRSLAETITEFLQQAEHDVYTLQDVMLGADVKEWFRHTIEASSSIIVLLSQPACTDPDVLANIEYAIQYVQKIKKSKLLPVRVNYTEVLPDSIRSFIDPLAYALWTNANDNELVAAKLLNAIADFAELTSPGSKGGEQITGDRGKLWRRGQAIRIRFMDGTDKLQWQIAKVAGEWTKYANLRFIFCDDPDAEARITFQQPGSWSFIGTDVLLTPKDQPTMNFGWLKPDTSQAEVHRVVWHEFGHLLGMVHEHQLANATIKWNKNAVYEYYARTNGWTKQQVEVNMFQKFSPDYFPVAKEFDPTSIMMYPISKEFTEDGMEINWNEQISEIDKDFVARLYPYP